jgi:hypothetical protein
VIANAGEVRGRGVSPLRRKDPGAMPVLVEAFVIIGDQSEAQAADRRQLDMPAVTKRGYG